MLNAFNEPVDRALIVVDMPFGTYQGNSAIALESAIRIMKEAEGHAVKLEGGSEIIQSIERILTAGIPVMGHLGLTPSVNLQVRYIHRPCEGRGRGCETHCGCKVARSRRMLRNCVGKNPT
jgi:ketopantoate hydroxymethyltransferase